MSKYNRKTFILSSAVAVILALGSTSVLASAMNFDDDDDSGPKSQACAAIGCANGARACASVTGTIKAGAPPFQGEISVTYNCYEAAAT